MNRGVLLLAVVGGAFGTVYLVRKAMAKDQVEAPVLPGPRVVLALGDSLTASEAYCKALSEDVPKGSSVTCRGLPGQGTGAILADLKTMYPGTSLSKFTDVVVLAGVNDIASGRSIATITHNLESIYTFIRSAGARPIAVHLTPWYSYKYRADWQKATDAVNLWISQSSLPAAVVKTRDLGDFQGSLLPGYTSGDGLHLNSTGCQKLAELVVTQGL